METETTLIANEEIKVEEENPSRKNEVKVTNILSEIRKTDLTEESPIQDDISQEKDTDSENKEKEEPKNGEKKAPEGEDKKGKEDNGEKKADDVEKIIDIKKSDNEDKNTDDSQNVENEGKKADDTNKVEKDEKNADDTKKAEKGGKKDDNPKKEEKDGKKADDSKKEDNGNKKGGDTKKLENEGKKVGDSKEVAKVGKKAEDGKKTVEGNKKSQKKEKVSPLAAFFKDWDKFTIYQKIDIEKFIMKKAEELGAPSKTKSGVRTYEERDRNRFKWNAIRRKRESRKLKESLRLGGSRSLRDRRSPIRLRGSGDSRFRDTRDDRRRSRYAPRRAESWRSPWVTATLPVENLMKQMERFVQIVDNIPDHRNMIQGEPKRPALLPTPPNGYSLALRENALTEIKPRDYTGNRHAQPQSNWSAPQYPVSGEESSRRFFGKEPSSKSLPKQRPTPYSSQPSYSSTLNENENWASRGRTYAQSTTPPYQESRYTYSAPYYRR